MSPHKLKYIPSLGHLLATLTLADTYMTIWTKHPDNLLIVSNRYGAQSETTVGFLQPGEYYIIRSNYAKPQTPYEQILPILTGSIESTFKISVSDTFTLTLSQCDYKSGEVLKGMDYHPTHVMNLNTLDSLNQELVRSMGEVSCSETNRHGHLNFGHIPPNMLKEISRDGTTSITADELVEYRLARIPRNLLLKFRNSDVVYSTDTDREAIGGYLKETMGGGEVNIKLEEAIRFFGCFNPSLNVDATTFTNNAIQTNLEFFQREGLDRYITDYFPKGRFKTVAVNDYYTHPKRMEFEASLSEVIDGIDTNSRWQEQCLTDFIEILESTIIPDAEKEGLDAIILVSPVGTLNDNCSWRIFKVLYTTKNLGTEVYNLLTLNSSDHYYQDLLKYYVCDDFYCYHSGFHESLCPF